LIASGKLLYIFHMNYVYNPERIDLLLHWAPYSKLNRGMTGYA